MVITIVSAPLQLFLEEQSFSLRAAQRTLGEKVRLYLLRIVLNLITLSLLGGAFYLIYFATQTSLKKVMVWCQVLLNNVVSSLACIMLFDFAPHFSISIRTCLCLLLFCLLFYLVEDSLQVHSNSPKRLPLSAFLNIYMTCATWSIMLTVFINSWIAHRYYCGMACGMISFHKGWPGVSYAAAVNKGISILGIWGIQTALIVTAMQFILSHFSNPSNWYFLFTHTLCVSSSYFPFLELVCPILISTCVHCFHLCLISPLCSPLLNVSSFFKASWLSVSPFSFFF